jgi:hypothetical protein
MSLLLVETDKVTVDIKADYDGVVTRTLWCRVSIIVCVCLYVYVMCVSVFVLALYL